jgi:hypothetical protein
LPGVGLSSLGHFHHGLLSHRIHTWRGGGYGPSPYVVPPPLRLSIAGHQLHTTTVGTVPRKDSTQWTISHWSEVSMPWMVDQSLEEVIMTGHGKPC